MRIESHGAKTLEKAKTGVYVDKLVNKSVLKNKDDLIMGKNGERKKKT